MSRPLCIYRAKVRPERETPYSSARETRESETDFAASRSDYHERHRHSGKRVCSRHRRGEQLVHSPHRAHCLATELGPRARRVDGSALWHSRLLRETQLKPVAGGACTRQHAGARRSCVCTRHLEPVRPQANLMRLDVLSTGLLTLLDDTLVARLACLRTGTADFQFRLLLFCGGLRRGGLRRRGFARLHGKFVFLNKCEQTS